MDAKGAVITLAEGIDAALKVSEISREKIDDARLELTVGSEIEAKVINVDRKNRSISLSIKAKDVSDEKAAVKAHRSHLLIIHLGEYACGFLELLANR